MTLISIGDGSVQEVYYKATDVSAITRFTLCPNPNTKDETDIFQDIKNKKQKQLHSYQYLSRNI